MFQLNNGRETETRTFYATTAGVGDILQNYCPALFEQIGSFKESAFDGPAVFEVGDKDFGGTFLKVPVFILRSISK